LAPRRERRAVLEQGEHGTLDARRRPLAQMFTALAERAMVHLARDRNLGFDANPRAPTEADGALT